jgi:hypothetical protein
MKTELVFRDKSGRDITLSEIVDMDAGELIHAYTVTKNNLIRLGTYSQSDCLIKFR